ncbi:MAG: hypothetical protein E3J94_07280 [Desulfobacteraceae bacterium]|nr:MAG: hypothetical protein E3J94_07280 [Desulfobacteraceae bacterium]
MEKIKYKDQIITKTEQKFNLIDRIRILFGCSVHLRIETHTEHLPGMVISESKGWVEPYFKQKNKLSGAYERTE